MPNTQCAEKIVSAYHHQNHRVADRRATAQTGLRVYESTLVKLSQELPAGDLVATLDLFERLLNAHITACAVCSQGAF
jgi:hypothetical protein